jgi:hypothetical protein
MTFRASRDEIIGVRKMISFDVMPLISYQLEVRGAAERNVARLPRCQEFQSVDVAGLEFVNGYTPQLN